jgi:hypothetical protein
MAPVWQSALLFHSKQYQKHGAYLEGIQQSQLFSHLLRELFRWLRVSSPVLGRASQQGAAPLGKRKDYVIRKPAKKC